MDHIQNVEGGIAVQGLIELHDPHQPLDNVIAATVLQPDVMVLIGDRKIEKNKYRKPLLSFLDMEGIHVRLDYRTCNLHDVQQVVGCLNDVLDAYGQESCTVDVGGGSDALLLAAGGAEVHATGCNPLSTQDDVCAALVAGGLEVFAHHGVTMEQYEVAIADSRIKLYVFAVIAFPIIGNLAVEE